MGEGWEKGLGVGARNASDCISSRKGSLLLRRQEIELEGIPQNKRREDVSFPLSDLFVAVSVNAI